MRAVGWRRAAAVASVVVATAGAGGATAAVSAVPSAPETPAAATADAPSSATVIIPKGAMNKGYQTKQITLAQGGTLTAVNFDTIQHTVTSVDKDAQGNPLFRVYVSPGSTVTIKGVDKLAAGSYEFYCQFHPTMRGTLTIVGGGGGGVKPTRPSFDQPLVVPPVLTGKHLRIPIRHAKVRVLPTGPRTRMWTFGGSYPGPTIRRPAGHDTKVTFVNKLSHKAGAFTVHLHGDHHRSVDDGQPTRHLIRPGHKRTYDYPLVDHGKPERAAFDWYHDHRMGFTARDNWMGLQGMFIVKDAKARELRLPRGRHDIPLMVSERSFRSDNQLKRPFPKHPKMMMTGPDAPPNDATLGTHILVNGRYAPYLHVATHRYRFRLLNSSPFTSYDFHLSDGRPFVQVGSGDGLLPKPVVRQDIMLGPAQRADVVVDFHGALHHRIVLESIPRSDPAPHGIGTPSASIMQFRVTRKADHDSTRLPARLQAPPPLDPRTKASYTWTVGLGGNQTTGTYWTINGKPFDPNRVDLKVPLGSVQTWKLRNRSPMTHFIHIHEEQWHTLSRDGHKPPPWERGLEDTWRLDPGETVKVAARFTDYTGTFMIHCHMLDHEDHGLMAQFEVVDRQARTASAVRPVSAPVGGGGLPLGDSLLATLLDVSRTRAVDQWMCRPHSRERTV